MVITGATVGSYVWWRYPHFRLVCISFSLNIYEVNTQMYVIHCFDCTTVTGLKVKHMFITKQCS
jgi:hypothetical protein